ncbi:MAG: DNA polymerase III subunit gamma/tau [Cytophagaceae bacterium]|nr:DNA polymerase III subunit gamma/tau [Cytophagaceae bacterium]
MEKNFVVSARKYRPVTFDLVVGQEHITTTLKNAIRTQHLAQAFLFCGPRGVGKTTCARILAKTINCQRLDDHVEPCGECDSCLGFQQNHSLDIYELDAASNNSVDDIRNLVDQVRYPPQMMEKNPKAKKVYIIDEVHMLSTSAFNAFLKTLEEPPSYAIFILATTEKHKILPTILSRCQIFDFNRIQNRDISEHLAKIADNEGIGYEPDALELIAQKADGGLRDALSMFDLNVTFSKDGTLRYAEVLDNLHILDYDYYFNMTDALLQQQTGQAFLLFDEILRKGFDGHQFVVGLLEHFRNLLVCKDAATVRLLQVTENVQRRYLEQSMRAPLSFLFSALSVGSQCDLNYKQAKNQKLHVEITLLKLAHLPAVLNLNALPAPVSGHTNGAEVSTPNGTEKKKPESEERGQRVEESGESGVVPPPPSVARPARLKSTVDITGTAATNSGTATLNATTEPEVRYSKPYTFEALQAAWAEFVQKREAVGRASEAVILTRDIKLEGHVIQIGLDNPLQLDLLSDFKADLLQFLREALQNSAIQLHAFVLDTPTQRMPYTQAEKFAYLAEKNPTLHELKSALGLDFDY